MERDPSQDILLKAGIVCVLVFLVAVAILIIRNR